jgi:8-oxo-dGTP diphosphatase
MNEIPECFYRVSVKALVLNETRDKFLLCKEDNGTWELPGGGLDWGSSPQEDLPREIKEEMGLEVTKVADNPSYFVTRKSLKGFWVVNILYEAELNHLNFTPSDECVDIQFVDKEVIREMKVLPSTQKFAEMFKVENHLK